MDSYEFGMEMESPFVYMEDGVEYTNSRFYLVEEPLVATLVNRDYRAKIIDGNIISLTTTNHDESQPDWDLMSVECDMVNFSIYSLVATLAELPGIEEIVMRASRLGMVEDFYLFESAQIELYFSKDYPMPIKMAPRADWHVYKAADQHLCEKAFATPMS